MELLAIILVSATLRLCYTTPITIHKDARFPKLEKSHPSHIRKVQLYSRQGFFLAIYENGTVGATTVRNSPDGKLLNVFYIINFLIYFLKKTNIPKSLLIFTSTL